MLNRTSLVVLILSAACAFLYLYDLSGTGLLGPDEPRYASIGRAMQETGDWVTPRLNGTPWFEKPALLYWLVALHFQAGFGEDWAPRLPNALLALLFLAFFYWAVSREFSRAAGAYATLVLSLSAGWLAFAQVAVTDLPLAVTFSLAMLFLLRYHRSQRGGELLAAAVFLGLAVLAKGLVPLVLLLPVAWLFRWRWRALLSWQAAALFLLTAVPWYLLCALRNGRPFLEEFFLRHHFSRFAEDSLQHVQPFWYYLPVLALGIFPWTPLLGLFRNSRAVWGAPRDDRRVFLLLWVAWGLLFFSVSVNKLPGYLLPLLPPLCALLGIALAETRRAPLLLGCAAFLFGLLQLIGAILPVGLRSGISRVSWDPALLATGAVPGLILAVGVFLLERKGRRVLALTLMAAAFWLGILGLKITLFPVLDRTVSVRQTWRENASRMEEICVGELHRAMRYGLDYYTRTPLPACEDTPRPLRITDAGTRLPRVEPNVGRSSPGPMLLRGERDSLWPRGRPAAGRRSEKTAC